MAPKLQIISQDNQVSEVDCLALMMIGRDSKNEIVLKDLKASRSHASIRCLGDGKYYLMDMGSANGTFVNDKQVTVPHMLVNGDQVFMGSSKITFIDDEVKEEKEGESADKPDSKSYATLVTRSNRVHKITVLVADIRSYTRLSEKLNVDLLGQIMSRWFQVAGEIVAANEGVVDKFIGDAVMVRWVARKDSKDVVVKALKTAHELYLACQKVNEEYKVDLPFPLQFGVGINTGRALLGNVGAQTRRDFTVLGDSVNLAFRLEAATRALQTDLVMGIDSYMQLPKAAWEGKLSSIMVKGKEKPIEICALKFDEVEGVLLGLSL